MAFEYLVKLRDALSGPAREMAGNISKLRDQLAKLQGSGTGSLLGTVTGANLLSDALHRVSSTALSAGMNLVKAASFRESSLIALETALGSKASAEAELSAALRIADKTPFDTKEVVNSLTRLSTAGLKNADDRHKLFGSLADLAVISGQGSEGLKRGTAAVFQSLMKGKWQGEEVTGQLGELGFNVGYFYDEVAKIYKITGDEGKRREKAMQLLSKGGVGGMNGAVAFSLAVQRMVGGGPTGAVAIKMSGTFEGLISNIKSGFDSLLMRAKVDEWPALVKLKDLLKDIGGLFAADSEGGKRLVGILQFATSGVMSFGQGFAGSFGAILSTIGSGLKSLFGGGDQEKALGRLQTLGAVLGGLAGFFLISKVAALGYATAMGVVSTAATVARVATTLFWLASNPIGWIVAAVAGVAALGVVLYQYGDQIWGWAKNMGSRITQGIVGGISEGYGAVRDAVLGLGSSMVSWFKDKLGIRSPSRVFAALGGFLGAGLAMGVDASAGQVRSSVESMVSMPEVSFRGGSAAVGAAARSISMGDINFNFGGSPQNPQEFVQQAAPLLRQALNNLLEEQYEEG